MTPTQAERNALFQKIQDMAAEAIGRMITRAYGIPEPTRPVAQARQAERRAPLTNGAKP